MSEKLDKIAALYVRLEHEHDVAVAAAQAADRAVQDALARMMTAKFEFEGSVRAILQAHRVVTVQ